MESKAVFFVMAQIEKSIWWSLSAFHDLMWSHSNFSSREE